MSVASIIGGCITVSDLVSKFAAWAVRDAWRQFHVYLWATFAIATGMPALWLVFDRTLRDTLKQAETRVKHGIEASSIQHEMAEAVRRCAAATAMPIDLQQEAGRVLHRLAQYLRSRLGETTYSVTIKATTTDGRLRAVFRDSGQKRELRCAWDDIALEDSPVYMRFRKAPSSKRIVYIGDTDQVPATEDAFRDRARRCGYRSVVGFPLRQPASIPGSASPSATDTDDLKIAKLLGFLSIDAPDPGAFNGLFCSVPNGSQSRDDDRTPLEDLDVCYGLADSIATILVLQARAWKPFTGGADHG